MARQPWAPHKWGPSWLCVGSEALVTGHSGRGALQRRVLTEVWGVLPRYPDFPGVLAHLTNLGSSTLWVFGLLGHGSSPQPLLHPQLQQTEAELRKVDEAIALFQKML